MNQSSNHMRKRVSLIVQVVDDFTDRPIIGKGVQVWITGAPAPLVKAEGYYVFINLQKMQVQLQIKHPWYYPQKIMLSLSDPAAALPIIKIRLLPNPSYPIPFGTTCIKGKAEPESQILVLNKTPGKGFKLLTDYDSRTHQNVASVTIYNPDQVDFNGGYFLIEDKEKSCTEYFTIIRTINGGTREYVLAKPLVHDYKKIGTCIYPVQRTKTDQTGDFFLLLHGSTGDKAEYQLSATGQKQITVTCELVPGTLNEVNLQKGE